MNNTKEYTEVLRATQGLCTSVIQSCANELKHLEILQIFTHKYFYMDMDDGATSKTLKCTFPCIRKHFCNCHSLTMYGQLSNL